MGEPTMTQQGQGDVAGQLERPHAVSILSMSKEALGASLNRAWDEIERLRTLLSSSRGEQGWRRIDSAPNSDEFILTFDARDPNPIRIRKADAEWWRVETCGPTHWMPLPSAPGSVPTSLAGQVPDGWDRIVATLREFSSLRAADGDYWEADAAERAAKEIERIPAENRPMLSASPVPQNGEGGE